jgi:drug/metabolite transporter (DMT)-like permease
MNVGNTLRYGRKLLMDVAIAYILIAVTVSAAGQIMLKLGMSSMGVVTISASEILTTVWRMGTNPYVLIGLLVYVMGTVFWLAALSRVDLSYAYPFASLSYIIMLIASWQLFKEDITLLRLIGTGVVALGIFLISRS